MRTFLTVSVMSLLATAMGGCVYERGHGHADRCPPPERGREVTVYRAAPVYHPAPVVVRREYYPVHRAPDFGRPDRCDW